MPRKHKTRTMWFVLMPDRRRVDVVPMSALERLRQKQGRRTTMMHRVRVSFMLLLVPAVPLLWVSGIVPSGSCVEIHPPPGEAVRIDCGFGFSLKVPTKQGGTLAFPVGYGKALFHVTFSDGKVVWAEFFNSDVGARRKIDIYVSHAAKARPVQFREVINGQREIFRGSVIPAKTSSDKPFLLVWI